MNKVCFECNSEEDIHEHHVVPESKGGTKTIPLCGKCHGFVHNKVFLDVSYLTREGLRKAKERGVKLGTNAKGRSAELQVKLMMAGFKETKRKFYLSMVPEVDKILADGKYRKLKHIAKYLNDNKIPSKQGGIWWGSSVKDLLTEYYKIKAENKDI